MVVRVCMCDARTWNLFAAAKGAIPPLVSQRGTGKLEQRAKALCSLDVALVGME